MKRDVIKSRFFFRGIFVFLMFVFFFSSFVSAADYKFQNSSGTNVVLIAGSSGNVTSVGWFRGLFDWFIKSTDSSSAYLTFNGSALSFSEIKLNATIDDRTSSITSGNLSWNESYAGGLYAPNTTSGIQDLINATGVYSTFNLSYATWANEWPSNFTNMQDGCPAGNYVSGILPNGTFSCSADITGPGGNPKSASGIYLSNDTLSIYFDETQLNTTIDDRIGSATTGNMSWNESYADELYSLKVGGNSINGTQVFNEGWTNGGLTIENGNLFAQSIFAYNITSLTVDYLRVNGSLLPQEGFDNTFNLGNSTLQWKNGYFGTDVLIGGEPVKKWLYNQTEVSNTYTDSQVSNSGNFYFANFSNSFDNNWTAKVNIYNDSWTTTYNATYANYSYNHTQIANAYTDSVVSASTGVWETNGNTFYNSSVSAVGIKTSNPASALHVNGTITVSNGSDTNDGQIYIDGSGDLVFRV